MWIREINPDSENEIRLVAARMGETLVEVLGPEKGASYYSSEWLIDRVRWHLDKNNCEAKVIVSGEEDQAICGHAIARLEKDEENRLFGYFSTIYVSPQSRGKGLALNMMEYIEQWFISHKMKKIIYNTAENHHRLIKIFLRRGYEITHRENEMVQLTKNL